jgi:hypothetical protein
MENLSESTKGNNANTLLAAGIRECLPEEILTPGQIQNALSWYEKHRNHVNSLVNGVSKFPPRLNEDKRDCRLWKPEHWNWFLAHYH